MRRLEDILLSKVPVWIVVVILVLTVAGAVAFGTLVEIAASRGADSGTSRAALEIARIPKKLYRLFFDLDSALAREQRFGDQAGLDFADPVHLSEGGEEGYLLLVRYVPEPVPDLLKEQRIPVYELIDLSRRKTVHVWHPDPESDASTSAVDVLPDGSLVVVMRKNVARLDACSNVEWRQRWYPHHSIERDADGNFWVPVAQPPLWYRDDGLLKFSPSGEALSRISLPDVLERGGYRHLIYYANARTGNVLHVNDVQPVLRDGLFWRRGDLFVSLRDFSIVLLYRPATDEVVWLRAGPWLHQHDVDIVSDSEISVFSNNTGRTSDGRHRVLGANEVYVYDFATGEARSPWRDAMRRHDVRTLTMGVATLLGDGGLMVEEHEYGRVLRLSADGALRWSYVNRGSDGRVYRIGWGRYLDAEYGAEVARSVAAADCTSSGPPAGAAH